MKNPLLFAASLVLACCHFLALPAHAQLQVDGDSVLRLGNTVELVGDGHSDSGEQAFMDAMGPPADDNAKWFITIYTRVNCAPCAKLKADLASDKHLRSLVNTVDHKASWSHFNEYSRDDESQAWRLERLKVAGFPTIVVQPPLNKRYGNPTTVVAQITGYTDGKTLANKIAAAIKLYCKHLPKQASDERGYGPFGFFGPRRLHTMPVAVGEYGQRTPPWRPKPKDDPQPTPAVDPPPLPPDFSPAPLPNVPDFPPILNEPEAPPIPKGKQIVLVTDGSEPEAELGPLKALVARHREKEKCKLRELDFDEARKVYPVTEEELPAVLITEDGEIQSKILGRLLPNLFPQPPPQQEKIVEVPVTVEVPKQVGLADVPWDVFLTILTGGFTPAAGLALAIWAFRTWRQWRKASGGKLLVQNDAVLEAAIQQAVPIVAATIERLLAARAKEPTPPPVSQ